MYDYRNQLSVLMTLKSFHAAGQPLACVRAWQLRSLSVVQSYQCTEVLVVSSRTSAMMLLVRDDVPRPLCAKSLQVRAG
jgi:hypothetical protein